MIPNSFVELDKVTIVQRNLGVQVVVVVDESLATSVWSSKSRRVFPVMEHQNVFPLQILPQNKEAV